MDWNGRLTLLIATTIQRFLFLMAISFSQKLIRLHKLLRHTNRIAHQFAHSISKSLDFINEMLIGMSNLNGITLAHSWLIVPWKVLLPKKTAAHFCPQKRLQFSFPFIIIFGKFWKSSFFRSRMCQKTHRYHRLWPSWKLPFRWANKKRLSTTMNSNGRKNDMRKFLCTALKHDCGRLDVPTEYKSVLCVMPFCFHSNLLLGKIMTENWVLDYLFCCSLINSVQNATEEKNHLNLLYVERRTWQTN